MSVMLYAFLFSFDDLHVLIHLQYCNNGQVTGKDRTTIQLYKNSVNCTFQNIPSGQHIYPVRMITIKI